MTYDLTIARVGHSARWLELEAIVRCRQVTVDYADQPDMMPTRLPARILSLLRERGSLTTSDVLVALRCHRRAAWNGLRSLELSGRIIRHERGSGVKMRHCRWEAVD